MFSELIKLRELERLLKKGRFLEVLALARDPAIRDHRRAVQAVERARKALLDEARRHREQGELTRAFQGVRAVLREAEDAEARRLETDLRGALGDRQAREKALAGEVEEARRLAARGEVAGAIAGLEPLADESREAARLLDALRRRRDAALAAQQRAAKHLEGGRPGEARGGLAEAQALDPQLPGVADLWARLLDLSVRQEDLESTGNALGDTRLPAGAHDADFGAARLRAEAWYLERIERLLQDGNLEEAAARLAVYPLDAPGDLRAAGLAAAVRKALRARRLLADGELKLAQELAREAQEELPPSAGIGRFLDDLEARQDAAREPLQQARSALAGGALLRARALLLDILEKQPGHREAQDLLGAVERQEAEDLETLRKARDLLGLGVEGSLDDCRCLLIALEARRPDLADVPVLLRDVDRRLREARLRALESEGQTSGAAAAHPGPGATAAGGPAPRPASGAEVPPGAPFILRVEEHGDWFVHPGDSVLIGNSLRGVADLPVLAAIGGRHVRIERHRTAQGDVAYRLSVEPGRRALRNRRPVTETTVLSHGDIVGLSEGLSFTFLRPVPGNATAVLRFEGDFSVHGCRHAILFSETGRGGSIVLGPGPEAHVPLGRDGDRAEILRSAEGEARGTLLVRSPRGVAVGEGTERAQIRAVTSVPLRAGVLSFFLDHA